jgi:GNAT superfamily N-acetyltransferase
MRAALTIELLDGPAARVEVDRLAALLVDSVEGGASLGFPRPLAAADARAWAEGVAAAIESKRVIVLVARLDGDICGSVQLWFSTYPNGRHRGEVAKLMVDRDARGQGIGTRLMAAIEAAAKEAGLRTLFLDTETGSDGERLYLTLGWSLAGVIPEFAASPEGGLRSSSFCYRLI